jgi:hypothetical protein
MQFIANKSVFEKLAKEMEKVIKTSSKKYVGNYFLKYAFVKNGALIASDGRQMIGIKKEFLDGINGSELKDNTAYTFKAMKFNKFHIAIELEEVENINISNIDKIINFDGFQWGTSKNLNSFLTCCYRVGCFDLNHLLTAFEVVNSGGANATFSKTRQFKVESDFAFYTCLSILESNPVFEPQKFSDLKAV